MKRLAVISAAVAAVALTAAAPAQAEWKPTKPVRIIVPWSAGGSTDQVVRVLAGEMEKALGQKVVVVNTPGGAGAAWLTRTSIVRRNWMGSGSASGCAC